MCIRRAPGVPNSARSAAPSLDMPVFPGDPLTPNIGATKDAKRLTREESPTLMKIPVLPIAYADALPLLKAMGGAVAPDAWRGALPITYHLGPGPAKVHLKLQFDWKLAPAYNVIARMRGAELPDEWIVRGNHHDAWVNGAKDPVSGMVAVMEEARAIGELAKTGWKPKRTLIFAGWDAEEPGLLGSTEWVEHHAEELRKHAVAYINSDSNGRGFWDAGGSHSLEPFINQVARDVPDPQMTSMSVQERARARVIVRGSADDSKEARTRTDLRIDALGSGSDYTPFLQHLGVASLNIGFGGEDNGGSYHSIYDSIDHYNRFGDPGYAYGVALAKAGGRAMLRLANADVLPFQFAPLAETIDRYLKEVTKLASDLRDQTAETNRRIKDGTLKAVADPKETYVTPAPKEPVPFLNFTDLQNALDRLQQQARAYDEAQRKVIAGGTVSNEVRQATGDAAGAGGARADEREGPAAAAVVHASDLRAGVLHRLWREDAAGRARSDRGAPVAGVRAAGGGDGGSDRSPGHAPAPRDGRARHAAARADADAEAALLRRSRRRVDVAPELIVVVLDPVADPRASASRRAASASPACRRTGRADQPVFE